jgi:hypothetical protein
MRERQKMTADLLNDPWIKLQTLSEWTDQHVNTLKNQGKKGHLKIVRLSPRCLRVRMSEALRYAENRDVAVAA